MNQLITRLRLKRATYIRHAAYLVGMKMMQRKVHPEVIADHLFEAEARAQRLEAKAEMS